MLFLGGCTLNSVTLSKEDLKAIKANGLDPEKSYCSGLDDNHKIKKMDVTEAVLLFRRKCNLGQRRILTPSQDQGYNGIYCHIGGALGKSYWYIAVEDKDKINGASICTIDLAAKKVKSSRDDTCDGLFAGCVEENDFH